MGAWPFPPFRFPQDLPRQQTSRDCGLIFPMDCSECAKSTPWRVVSYTSRFEEGCFAFPIPRITVNTEYWLECQEGSHGYRLRSRGFKWAKRLDYIVRAYSKKEVTEADYSKESEHAMAMLKHYMSRVCYEFPTSSKTINE